MIPSARNIGREYEGIIHRRTILLVTHIVLGLISGFVLMSREDFSHYHYWNRVGIPTLVGHLLVSWPYLVSGLVCYVRSRITIPGLVAFEVILVAGTALGAAVYLGAMSIHLEGPSIMLVPLAQACIFTTVAVLLMVRSPSS
jgi:hypothetical protein